MRLPKLTEIFRICRTSSPAHAAVAGIALLAVGASAHATRPATDAQWQVAIVPEQTGSDAGPQLVPPAPEPVQVAVQADAPAPAEYFDVPTQGIEINPLETVKVEVNGRTYEDVYRSIPFNHTEYVANPSYRHEATMEILFGQLRPMTIVKNQAAQPIVNDVPSPYQPYRYSQSERWQYHAPDFRMLDPGCCF